MKYDLTTDDGLRCAWRDICQSANVEDSQKDIVQKFDKLEQEDFLSEDYQRLLWEENEICSIKRPPRVKVDEIIQDNTLITWFYNEYRDIKEKESSQRIIDLPVFVEKLYTDLTPYTTRNQRPICRTYRTMATLFPEDFTRLANPRDLATLAKFMGIQKGHPVIIHDRILKRLADVLEEPNGLDEKMQRMILTWNLFDATRKEKLGENLDPPSDEGQRPDDSTTSVEVQVPQLKDILPKVENKGYFPNDLCQKLHLGLWADERRHFAVLTGLSGAGKTLLARAYAKAITGEDPTGENPKRSCIVAIEPGWTDRSYLLGYANPLKKLF